MRRSESKIDRRQFILPNPSLEQKVEFYHKVGSGVKQITKIVEKKKIYGIDNPLQLVAQTKEYRFLKPIFDVSDKYLEKTRETMKDAPINIRQQKWFSTTLSGEAKYGQSSHDYHNQPASGIHLPHSKAEFQPIILKSE
jgi:hypothetical protein